MTKFIDRREFLELAALSSAGVVFASALEGGALAQSGGSEEFYFVQISDTHWGFEGPPNPDARGTLPKAIRAINRLAHKPDFIVFTGDLTHTTDDAVERRARMTESSRSRPHSTRKRCTTCPASTTHRSTEAPRFASCSGRVTTRSIIRGFTSMFPLPAPHSQPKRTPLPWNPAKPYDGLGFRSVEARAADARYVIDELPVQNT